MGFLNRSETSKPPRRTGDKFTDRALEAMMQELDTAGERGQQSCLLTIRMGPRGYSAGSSVGIYAKYLEAEGHTVANVNATDWGPAYLTVVPRASASVNAATPAPGTAEPVTPTTMPGFDPQGPEKAAAAAKDAYNSHDWASSFELSVKAVDRLHDFYVYEQFRNRQPSPGDAWIVNGLVSALGVLRDQNPNADVAEAVKEATHRLRTITTAVEGAGGNATLYRGGLDGLARYAPDIDVSDVFW